jgi:hypothetical protein
LITVILAGDLGFQDDSHIVHLLDGLREALGIAWRQAKLHNYNQVVAISNR